MLGNPLRGGYRTPLVFLKRLHVAIRMSGTSAKADLATQNGGTKRPRKLPGLNTSSKKLKKRERDLRVAATSNEAVLDADVLALGAKNGLLPAGSETIPERFTEVEVHIESLSSTGDGLGRVKGDDHHIYVVPFSLPGDVVLAKIIHRVEGPPTHIMADFVRVVTPSTDRDDSLVRCPYFQECSGCQFQMLPYSQQLAHKKTVVERAFRNFSHLPREDIPSVQGTIGSPFQYAYRTKLTPHFDGPRNARKLARKGQKAHFESVPPIGFMKRGSRITLDIEDCYIATDTVRAGLKEERTRVNTDLQKYSKGATLLLRETTESEFPLPSSVRGDLSKDADIKGGQPFSHSNEDLRSHSKSCVTDPKATCTEYVGGFKFTYNANSFFQNNNSILPLFTAYIRDLVLPDPTSGPNIRNLIDAYCGAGLFSITLSALFERTIGIDIDEQSIQHARANGKVNNIGEHSSDAKTKSVEFIAADASRIFESVQTLSPEETVVILDPPRKGCDESFLRQLLAFGPERIVYVSCNVHTQASDVGWLLGRGSETEQGSRFSDGSSLYEIESLRGFDFFPQTSHVEGVAVLRKKHERRHEDNGVGDASSIA